MVAFSLRGSMQPQCSLTEENMKKAILVLVMVSLPLLAGAGLKDSKKMNPSETVGKEFGGKITSKKVTDLGEVMKNYHKYKGEAVVFEAKAKKVCEQKGCWMVLKDGNKEVRTLFKDYGFFVPKTIVGKKVRVQGTMKRKKVSAATIRHFMKDEGKKMEDIQKVKTGQIQYEFEADAVEII